MNFVDISQAYFNIAVGTATGSFVIAKGITGYINHRKAKTLLSQFKKRYPRKKINKTFQLVDTERTPGKIYLLDFKNKKRLWISSSSTFNDLDFHTTDVDRIELIKFDKYKEGAAIWTRGVKGR